MKLSARRDAGCVGRPRSSLAARPMADSAPEWRGGSRTHFPPSCAKISSLALSTITLTRPNANTCRPRSCLPALGMKRMSCSSANRSRSSRRVGEPLREGARKGKTVGGVGRGHTLTAAARFVADGEGGKARRRGGRGSAEALRALRHPAAAAAAPLRAAPAVAAAPLRPASAPSAPQAPGSSDPMRS